jgi:MarR family transcriptional regulator, lower aerobic nicotinate degradation pathway regulator
MKDDVILAAQTAFDLASRPGFLIRRLHQIHLALFAEECGAFNVTPVQYSILTAAAAQPGLEQARLAHEVGVDRTTLANVVARLESRGLVKRVSSRADKRLKRVQITARGRKTLERMDGPARRAHARTIAALGPQQRALFLQALASLVDSGNAYGRAPLRLG